MLLSIKYFHHFFPTFFFYLTKTHTQPSRISVKRLFLAIIKLSWTEYLILSSVKKNMTSGRYSVAIKDVKVKNAYLFGGELCKVFRNTEYSSVWGGGMFTEAESIVGIVSK